LNTPPATAGGRILGAENWMTSHRRLLAIIFWKSGRNPGIYQFICVFFYGLKTFVGDVISVFLGYFEF
jgi:hypothetical protein